MSGPSDTSYTERIRRLRGKAVAVAVGNGTPLETTPRGKDYETKNALRLGNSANVRDTPGGIVTTVGCGCNPPALS